MNYNLEYSELGYNCRIPTFADKFITLSGANQEGTMQIRCINCHRPFALGKEAVNAALDEMVAEELTHYDVRCPHCRRTNRVTKDELMRAAPAWKPNTEEAKTE